MVCCGILATALEVNAELTVIMVLLTTLMISRVCGKTYTLSPGIVIKLLLE